jgi:hypothetical protein
MIRISTRNVDYAGFRTIPRFVVITDPQLQARDALRNPVNIMALRVLRVNAQIVGPLYDLVEY